ncbi:hypothetical protein ABZV34_36175 [Streptomyces sp. NPDC005195]|uniref:hypothetical protein n=1 Tax=Streptomyces sp. NPDC005195 TaxID=3154561 RepID=UPI00339FFC56
MPQADLAYEVTVLSDICADLNSAPHHTLVNDVLTRHREVTTVEEWAHTLDAGS